MIQYPKQVHMTLPSVGGWNTNLNIIKDPPKSKWTRRIDKVSDTQEINNLIDGSADRICEMIKVYPRGINPMVSVSYSNYGTNGGQNRQITNSGTFGKKKMCNDGRRPYIGQAKLPYKIIDNNAFRPPVKRQEDLLPLSRLPRTSTQAYTQPGFVNYTKKTLCPDAKDMRQIQNKIITNVKPTEVYNFQKINRITSFPIRQVIDNPLYISGNSNVRTLDRSKTVNIEKFNNKMRDFKVKNVRSNLSGNKQNMVNNLNSKNYVNSNITYSTVKSNLSGNKTCLMENSNKKELPIKDSINVSATSGICVKNGQPLQENSNYILGKNIPKYKVSAVKTQNKYIRNTEQHMAQLEDKRPKTFISQFNIGNKGGVDVYANNSRTKKIKDTLCVRENFLGKPTIPKSVENKFTNFRTNTNKMSNLKKYNITRGERFQ